MQYVDLWLHLFSVGLLFFLLIRELIARSRKKRVQDGAITLLHAIQGGSFEILAIIPLLGTLFFPWRLIRYVLIPLGQIRASCLVARWLMAGFGNDRSGGVAMVAAMALLHKTNTSEADVTWVERQLNQASPLRACGIVAAAFLRLHTKDDQGARQLLQSIEQIQFTDSPSLAFRVAREWLAVDAAERGDWDEILGIISTYNSFQLSRITIFLGVVARRLLNQNYPSDLQLWISWALAPERLLTRPLLLRALATPRSSLPPTKVDFPYQSLEKDVLREALRLQVQVGQLTLLRSEDLVALGLAWDRALVDDSLERRLLIRSMDLAIHPTNPPQEELRESVANYLADLAQAHDLPLWEQESNHSESQEPPTSPTLERARYLLREALLTELEIACNTTRARATEKRPLPTVDEWQEALLLRKRYQRIHWLVGEEALRIAWSVWNVNLCKLAVWLYNDRNEKTIAHAMFQWLLAEAIERQDQDGIELQRKNVACGPG